MNLETSELMSLQHFLGENIKTASAILGSPVGDVRHMAFTHIIKNGLLHKSSY